MGISIAPDHLAKAKQQAHSIRNNLSELIFSFASDTFSKNQFLNIWASCMRFKDWGEFNATSLYANKHKQGTGDVIITPATIGGLARELNKHLFNPELTDNFIESILFASAYDNEKALFAEHDRYVIGLPGVDYTIEIDFGPTEYERVLVDLLFNKYPAGLADETAHVELLAYAKDKRKTYSLTRANAKQRHLDIYQKSGVSPEVVYLSAVDNGWLERFTDFSHRERITGYRLTDKALEQRLAEITEDYGPEWVSWNTELKKLCSNPNVEFELFDTRRAVLSFAKGVTPHQLYSSLTDFGHSRSPQRADEHTKLIETVLSQTGEEAAGGKHFFHCSPLFLLRYNDPRVKTGDVIFSCDISTDSGTRIDVPDLVISKPYPNKRYLVAGTDKTGQGWFCCLPADTREVICDYTWQIKSLDLVVKHQIRFLLNYSKGNRLFSPVHKDNAKFYGNSYCPTHSFAELGTISGSAGSVEEVKQLPRFQSQIERYQRTSNTIEIIERCNLRSCAFGGFQ